MPVVAAIAGLTIVAGNLMAIPQQNIKRLLAYSGIAHIGYLLMGLAAMSAAGIGMVLFYLVAYLFGNMGAFFVVQAVAASEESDQIDGYRGLARRSPVLALSLLVFLLSLGGIPFMAGFWAKLFIFWAVVEQGMYWLAFLGAVRRSSRSTTTWSSRAGCISIRPSDPAPSSSPVPLLLAIPSVRWGRGDGASTREPLVRSRGRDLGPLTAGSG